MIFKNLFTIYCLKYLMQSMDNQNDCGKFLKRYNCYINAFVTHGNLTNSLKHFFHESQS